MHRVDRNVFLLTPRGTEVRGLMLNRKGRGFLDLIKGGRGFLDLTGRPGPGPARGRAPVPRSWEGHQAVTVRLRFTRRPYRPHMTVSSLAAPAQAEARPDRPGATELRLAAFAAHRRARFPLGPLTLFTGPSGSGKTGALRAYEALARLGGGAALGEVFPDPVAGVPERARPDAQRRRGFRIGCTVDGP